ncbi:glycerol-3-phosphate acyltransferase [Fervidibacillus halotolerans]|uniref:Glycerol-3-phosphate acyltransferase n=1 Tax=Fervidibacillus halotolerans TaxID=2980027 RepID=A0A9E8M1Z0_9BACI|nr:glycerol-3-phosphate acyltransferase [Fervidibacillus halotolerans]WAA13415.1 glycerol-3-phosphate acyltransferase [Fervidibacillus halotolerans]
MIFLLTLISFFSGSLMFSYWLGLLKKKNIKSVGDGNPGAANLWKAAGYKFGIFGVLLDFLKGYIPIKLILKNELVSDVQWLPIALAPLLGHAFSPFLKFHGGKALAVSFGMWSALTSFHVSFAYAVILAIMFSTLHVIKKGKPISSEEDGFQATLGMFLLSFYLHYRDFPMYILAIWLGNFLLFLYKNRTGNMQVIKNWVNKRNRELHV